MHESIVVASRPKSLEIIVWDVQHGSAAYVRTPNDKNIAVDMGTGAVKEGQPFSPLLHLRHKYGITKLDGLIVTHPHRDHIDDIENIDLLPPTVFRRPKHLTDNEVRGAMKPGDESKIEEYLKFHARYSMPLTSSVAGASTPSPFSASVNGCDYFESFHPKSCNHEDLNDHSIVTVIRYAGTKILFPGDNESCSWKELLSQPAFVKAIEGTHILVASHHGRLSGFHENLFNYITPKLVVVSDGPATLTSAVGNYHAKVFGQGWKVWMRSGGSEHRKVLTTRSDGVIVITCYKQNQTNYLDVTVD